MSNRFSRVLEIIKYSFFGGITTLINLAILYFLVEVGLNYIFANTIGYIVAVIINFFFNIRFVFESDNTISKREVLKQFFKFFGVRIVSLGVDNALFYCCVTIMEFPLWPSRILLSAFIIIATYIINKMCVFIKQ